MDDYLPISCINHERLEFAVLRKLPLHLHYEDEDGNSIAGVVHPLDVFTRAGAEWLCFRDMAGSEAEIRLDRIIAFEEIQRPA